MTSTDTYQGVGDLLMMSHVRGPGHAFARTLARSHHGQAVVAVKIRNLRLST